MARASDNGWDFVEEGMILQYKEDHFVGVVKIVEDTSDEDYYNFKLRVLAGSHSIPEVGEEFTVSFVKNFSGVFSGMSQFYINPEYCPMPLGSPWPYAEKGYKFWGIPDGFQERAEGSS